MIRPELRKHYGYRWRFITRPRILRRAGGSFDQRGRYVGGARCERCNWIDHRRRRSGSGLEIAHLDGLAGHDADGNLAALCHRCHRAHDYAEWARKVHATWVEKADMARPILAFLLRGLDARRAVDEAIAAAAPTETPQAPAARLEQASKGATS